MRDLRANDHIGKDKANGCFYLQSHDENGRPTSATPLVWSSPEDWAKWWLRQAELFPDKIQLDETDRLLFEKISTDPNWRSLVKGE